MFWSKKKKQETQEKPVNPMVTAMFVDRFRKEAAAKIDRLVKKGITDKETLLKKLVAVRDDGMIQNFMKISGVSPELFDSTMQEELDNYFKKTGRE